MKGTDRNKPCACGSGVKAKRCACREEARQAELERERAELRAMYERRRNGTSKVNLLMAMAAAMVPPMRTR